MNIKNIMTLKKILALETMRPKNLIQKDIQSQDQNQLIISVQIQELENIQQIKGSRNKNKKDQRLEKQREQILLRITKQEWETIILWKRKLEEYRFQKQIDLEGQIKIQVLAIITIKQHSVTLICTKKLFDFIIS